MDVSCPRCKTEYEFDDARVPEGGVTVKCTNCSHVFRVKRAEGPSGEVPRPPPTQPDPMLPPASVSGVAREWKVRQPSGNVFTFKELTTLQKWIVERKVARQDEISLTGETWKRLGDIPELASFFIVVDEALRAARLEAAKESGAPPPSAPEPAPQVSAPVPAPRPSAPAPEPPAPRAASDSGQFPISRVPRELDDRPATDETLREPLFAFSPPGGASEPKPGKGVLETLKEPSFSTPAVSPARPVQVHDERPRAPAPRPAPRPSAPAPRPSAPPPPAPPPRQLSAELDPDRDWEAPVVRRSSGTGWIFFLLAAALVGGGAGYYFAIYLPEQGRLEDERAAEAQRLADAAEEEARAKAEAEEKARLEAQAAPAVDAGAPVAATPEPPKPPVAATPEPPKPPVAAAVDAGAPAAPAPKRDFEWYLAQGDKLRDREKPDKALDMYGQAADLEPERVEPIAGRGLALLDMGKTLQAEASFQEALKLNGRYAPAIMGLAETYRLMKKSEQAVQWYQKYLDVLPNGPEANVAKSNIERLKPKEPEPAPAPAPAPESP